MQCLRDQFLAGSAFAEHEHRAINRGGSLDLRKHVLHLLGLADDLVEPELLVEPTAEADLEAEPETAADAADEPEPEADAD